MSLTVEGGALARVTFNALTFIPKSARNKFVRVTFNADTVEFAASDEYTAGKDSAPAHGGPGQPVSFALSRDDLEELEATSRLWKKSPILLTLTATELVASGPGEPVRLTRLPIHSQAWRLLDRLYAVGEQGSWLTGPVAFDPNLFARFGKVKSVTDRVADYLLRGPELPVLVKVGPTFCGLVMPLQRARAEAHAPGTLW